MSIDASAVHRSIDKARSSLEEAAEQIVWQIENEAWKLIGYADWDEMREAVYGGTAVIVPRADRPELSSRLRAQGLTQQQISNTLGVGQSTVERDLNTQMGNEASATITNSRGQQRPTSYSRSEPEQPLPEQRPNSDLPASEQLSEFINSGQDVQNARYLANFAKAMARSDDFLLFDAERIGRLADDDIITGLDLLADQLTRFIDRVKRERSGLRVIQGEKR